MTTPRRLPWFLLAALAAGCSSGPVAPPGVESWLTTGDRTQLLALQPRIAFDAAPAAGPVIEVDAGRRYQRMVGFGASITDASAWLLRHRMTEAQRAALLKELFGREGGGLGFDFTRLTIGASDFSLHHYSLDDMPPGQSDPTLARFSIEPNRADLLPVLKQALALNPQLQVMASPWSAPGWMKTTDSLLQGSLRPDRYAVFADYLVRYVDAFAAEGITIFALTLQNEPHFEPKDYPGMRLDPAARARVVADHLGPLLRRRGLSTRIIEWDHNWDEPAAPLAVLADAKARAHISGVAWHCYAGQPEVQAQVHDAFPDQDAWFTECSGGEWKPHWPETLPWLVRNIVIGSTRGWARGVLMWNLALDENHGPHLGGCEDCRGVVTIDSRSGAVTRNMEYYALGHASRFVRPGAERIHSSAAVEGVENVAFRNADDGSLVMVATNPAPEPRTLAVREGPRVFRVTLPRESVATFVWRP